MHPQAMINTHPAGRTRDLDALVRAGISYALTEAMDEGHCGLPTDELVPLAEKPLEVRWN